MDKCYKAIKHILKKRSSRLKLNAKTILLTIGLCATMLWWFAWPDNFFNDPTSTVIESNDNQLLAAHIAADGQWRFPQTDSIPSKYQTCLLAFEDQYFYYHPGVNPFAIARALWQNIESGEIASGGSTITMQLIRMARKNKARTIYQKIIEIILATRAEVKYSKNEILAKYASHAPFGGNVVGIDAAAWRYFATTPDKLSWAEAATLAVLPNSPALIYPGKRNQLLLEKRNRLLDKLYKQGKISQTTLELAKIEPIPQQTHAIPQIAPHLLSRNMTEHYGKKIKTTLSTHIQKQANSIVTRHLRLLKANDIHNAAAIILETHSGKVLAYVGNNPDTKALALHGERVDIIRAPRSSGSILKPFLYAAALDAGQILPETLIPDIPTQIGGFSPQNFNLKYTGAIHASSALARSLNIPSVKILQQYGTERFYNKLKEIGISSLNQPHEHYGLSIILGGGETTLWEVASAYASMGRLLIDYEQNDGTNYAQNFRQACYIEQEYSRKEIQNPAISPEAAWLTVQALLKVNRPNDDANWQTFNSAQNIAWKTGTSFGFRDAWAVGITPEYTVAVWCGNADGEGRPMLTGTSAAAPLMLQLFSALPAGGIFSKPSEKLFPIATCHHSGHRIGPHCTKADTILVPQSGLKTSACPYHQIIHLDPSLNFQVTDQCCPLEQIVHQSHFTLPPIMAHYYQLNNPLYKALPPFMAGCMNTNTSPIDLIYPRENRHIFIPTQLDGTPGTIVFQATHQNPNVTIFWHFNNQFIAQTKAPHKLPFAPTPGEHIITITDDSGNTLYRKIVIMDKQ
ncbi:MAG: penicillin-binding protein 1C [Mangrovibacterium sp.]